MASLKTPSVRTVERTVALLEQLSQSRSGLSLSELSRHLAAPKSSLHCVLLTLERAGYVNRNQRTGRYVLGLKLFGLANAALGGLKLRGQAAPPLHALAERTRLTVHLAILERGEAVLVERINPLRCAIPSTATWIGKRMEVHCTAVGKAIAASLTDDELRTLVRERPLMRHNDNTVVSMKKLRDELARVRRLGYSVDDEEEEIGLRCIGMPIPGADGKTVAAVSISGTTEQITAAAIPRLVGELRRAAGDVSRALQPDAVQHPEHREPLKRHMG
jgi:DNA-binding IclR family transcriptional regulator